MELTSPARSSVEVALHGAHVLRWTEPSGADVLYLSPRSRFGPGVSIRGGVPVIFPQFADLGPLPKHGFARTSQWALAGEGSTDEAAWALLRLADSPATRAVWDHAFELELRVTLSDVLEMELAVRNTGSASFDFTAALHTYLAVGDVRRAAVAGLDGVRYHDKVARRDEVQRGDLRFSGETDRVYLAAPDELRITDEADRRTIVVEKRGFADAVVWNPWAQKAAEVDDLGEDQFPRFLCVEAAQVGAPVRLEPGARWTAAQVLRVER